MKYIGVKIVEAIPMTASIAGNTLKRTVYILNAKKSSDGEHHGYLVTYPDGYKSWCPKAQFEKANCPCEGMTFGHAIEALKLGKKVCRAGWNGKGMWLRYVSPYTDDQFLITETELAEGTLLDYIGMKTADEGFVPWLASQTDVLSDDWMIVE